MAERETGLALRRVLAALVFFLLAAVPTGRPGNGSVALAAGTDILDTEQRKALAGDVYFLFSLLEDDSLVFRPARIKTLLRFVNLPKDNPAGFRPPDVGSNTAAYWEVDLDVPLDRILAYTRHPGIPSYFFFPASLRLDGALVRPGPGPVPSGLEPVVQRWSEYEVNAPDTATGTYYRYEQNRMVLLFKEEGRTYQVSVTRLKDKSSVARKGAIVGPVRDWNFFYSGVEGVTKRGLGWADAYIYDGASINVLFEPVPGAGVSRMCLFKWLRAGWASINLIRTKHLIEGFERFSAGFKEVIESPLLPSPEEIAGYTARVRRMPQGQLRGRMVPLALDMERYSEEDPVLSRNEFRNILAKGGYVNRLDREEMESELLRMYLKEHIRPAENAARDGGVPGGGGAADISPGGAALQ